jgi:hypothetical protein
MHYAFFLKTSIVLNTIFIIFEMLQTWITSIQCSLNESKSKRKIIKLKCGMYVTLVTFDNIYQIATLSLAS